MRNLFLSIYGGIFTSILLVIAAMYFLIQHVSEARYQTYLQQVSQLTVTLVTNGVNRQKPENRERWLSLVSSLMAVDIRINKRGDYQVPGLIKQGEQYLIIGQHSDEQPLQVILSMSNLTEKWLSATTFLALNELGHYPLEQRSTIFEQLASAATFNVERLPKEQISLSSKQRRQLELGDTVLVRSAKLGQQEWIRAYAPWGNTNDVLTIGPIPFFQAYPLKLLLTALIATLALIAFTVWLLLNKLRKRLLKIQQTVDSIGPSYYDSQQTKTSTDAISELNSKILSMRNSIERLLDDQAYMIRAVSHDLRTPIAKLRFRLEAITMIPDQQPELVEECKQDINSLNGLIDELLTYERLTTKPDISLEQIDLYPMLARELEDIQTMQTHLQCTIDSQGLKNIELQGNLLLLKRLFSNLLTNASKYANSKITIEIRQSQSKWLISVRDDGPGFDTEVISQVFKPFFKADSARTTQTTQGGYGLGLAIAKQIAKQHQGDVELSSNSCEGACLSVSLPITGKKLSANEAG